MKKDWIYISILLLSVVLYVIVNMLKPAEIDWTPTFHTDYKKPYDTLILEETKAALLPESELIEIRETAYEFLYGLDYWHDDAQKSNYFFTNFTLELDEESVSYLLEYISEGNNVFISATDIGDALADTLQIRIKLSEPSIQTSYLNGYFEPKSSTRTVELVHPAYENESYTFPAIIAGSSIAVFDTLNTVVLGTFSGGNPNFIKMKVGEGSIFIHTLPFAFTNYAILREENISYVSKVLSYLPPRKTYWDLYYRVGSQQSTSLIRFIQQQPSLNLAWLLSVFGIMLLVFVKAKRKQRVIPIIVPPKNTSLTFVETIGRLYHQQNDHWNIADKKITYFLEQVRIHFFLQTDSLDENFITHLSKKSGKTIDEVREVVNQIQFVRQSKDIGEHDLKKLVQKLDAFALH